MKRLLLLFIPLVFFFGCEEEEQLQNETVGYNCSQISDTCVESADGFYLNLEDCENECLVIYGCTDSSATNYDPNATDDDGSCCKICALNLIYANDEFEDILDDIAVSDGFSDYQASAEYLLVTEGIEIGEVCGTAVSDSENAWDDFAGNGESDIDGDGVVDVFFSYSCE